MARSFSAITNLPLPASDVNAAPLVAVLINPAWSMVLLSLASLLEDTRVWEDGIDSDRALFQTYFLYDQIRAAKVLEPVEYPKSASVMMDEAIAITGSAFVTYMWASMVYGFAMVQNTVTLNDQFILPIFLDAGTYRFNVLGFTQSASGKLSWYLDGNLIVADQNWYSSVATANVTKRVTDVTVAHAGNHMLSCVHSGKGITTGGYLAYLTKVWFDVP